LSESAALKLHPKLEQKIKDGTFPTPFHPGTQWAAEPATTAGATTASAAPVSEPVKAVDPLVGLWWEASIAASDCERKWCFVSIGQDQNGNLKGVTWVPEWASKYSIVRFHQPDTGTDIPWPVGHGLGSQEGFHWQDMWEIRSVILQPNTDEAYNWTIDREIKESDYRVRQFCQVSRGAKSGRLKINEGSEEATFYSNKALCGGFSTLGTIVFHRVTANGAAVLHLPEWYQQQLEAGTMPSPFVGMDQWPKAPASVMPKVEKIPQTTDNEPQEFRDSGR